MLVDRVGRELGAAEAKVVELLVDGQEVVLGEWGTVEGGV